MRSLMNALGDGVFVAQEYRFVFANAALPAMLGFAADEFVDIPFARVVAPETLPLWNLRFAQRIGRGVEPPRAYEVRFLTKHGTGSILLELVATRSTYLGRPAVIGVLRDITDRKKIADELDRHRNELADLVEQRTSALRTALAARQEADDFTRLVADNIPGRIAYLDSEWRCRFVNRGYCEWLGKEPAQLLGQPASAIFGPEQFGAASIRIEAALRGDAQRFEQDEADAAGIEEQTTLLQLVPDRRDGTIRGIFLLALDVSESRRAKQSLEHLNQELVRALDRAEAAGRAKGAFLANMSHEIRTPMNAIIGLTHLLRRDNVEGVTAERLSRVSDAARHLLELVNDILDLSKIESGKLVLEQADFTLDSLLTRACALVHDAAREKGLEIVIDTDHVPGLLRGDQTRLSQALVNLLGNAVKFTERGSVTVVSSLMAPANNQVDLRFEVRDTGLGISPDRLGRLFTAFEQADPSTTRRYGGSGLGLAITRHLAQLMGGDAGASSEPGAGSRFWFTARLASVESEAPEEREPLLAGRRALLVDDLLEARVALSQMLRRLGLRTDAAATGIEAVSAAAAASAIGDPYDIVLLDWLMPGTDGVATVQQLLAQDSEHPPACIILSVEAGAPGVREAAVELGITSLLQKPVSIAMLHRQLMQQLVDRRPESRPAGLDLLSEGTLRGEHGGARVLLAEDNPVNQEVATSLLRLAGLRVDVACNGREAVAMASATNYALILMDMQMPELDGIGATKLLRAQVETARTPIIAMTANAYVDDRKDCMAAGMNDFLSKPVDPPVLYDMLTRWLRVSMIRTAPDGGAPTATATSPTEVSLPQLPGLDVVIGQACFAYDAGFYRVGLRRFADLYAHGDTVIDDALAAYRERGVALPRKQLRQALHSFGGASASVGARQLADESVNLGERLVETDADGAPRDDDPSIARRLSDLQLDLRELVRGLEASLSDA